MPKQELTHSQHLKVIDFLKRWGIDSPELVFELTDHYEQMALERIESGESFENVLDSWKTKRNFITFRIIQSEFETSTRRKWWKNHIAALRSVFMTRQFLVLLAILLLMILFYSNDSGDVFSLMALITLVLSTMVYTYFFHSKKYGMFFELREMTVPVMGAWYIVSYFISHGGHSKILNGELVELPAPLVLLSLVSWFMGYNLITRTQREVKDITKEYLREADKYNIV